MDNDRDVKIWIVDEDFLKKKTTSPGIDNDCDVKIWIVDEDFLKKKKLWKLNWEFFSSNFVLGPLPHNSYNNTNYRFRFHHHHHCHIKLCHHCHQNIPYVNHQVDQDQVDEDHVDQAQCASRSCSSRPSWSRSCWSSSMCRSQGSQPQVHNNAPGPHQHNRWRSSSSLSSWFSWQLSWWLSSKL